jgi:phosphate:Na+ symporter
MNFDFFDLLKMIGGLALFLYGMHMLSEGLEKISGGKLERILEKMTDSRWKAVLLGAGVTAVIQSSSATTVMVVGFVNSGIMKLSQAIGVIMGANVGTTITSWLLSLTGLEGDSFLLKLIKPTSFSPVLAIIGVVFIVFLKNAKKRDIGGILVGFAILMTGMNTMSDAMKPLSENPTFTGLFTMFANPFLGLIVGALLTAVIQSSSASVGILQALCATGKVTYASAVPIILGQNIGTCVTAMMSGVGAGKNAKRAATIHLMFNVIGVAVFMAVFYTINFVMPFAFLGESANSAGIALVHTCFNILATLVLLPFANQLERLSFILIKPDDDENARKEEDEIFARLDERLLATPSFALEQTSACVLKMADLVEEAVNEAMTVILDYDKQTVKRIEQREKLIDRYDDEVSGYLVKLSARNLTESDTMKLNQMLHGIGDLERIADHAMNLGELARSMNKKEQHFSSKAAEELRTFSRAVTDIVQMSVRMFQEGDLACAKRIEPFEEAIDRLQKDMKKRHTKRLKKGKCTAEMGFVLSDITNNYERIADHCSNLAIGVMQLYENDTYAHEYVDSLTKDEGSEFDVLYQQYLAKYRI